MVSVISPFELREGISKAMPEEGEIAPSTHLNKVLVPKIAVAEMEGKLDVLRNPFAQPCHAVYKTLQYVSLEISLVSFLPNPALFELKCSHFKAQIPLDNDIVVGYMGDDPIECLGEALFVEWLDGIDHLVL